MPRKPLHLLLLGTMAALGWGMAGVFWLVPVSILATIGAVWYEGKLADSHIKQNH